MICYVVLLACSLAAVHGLPYVDLCPPMQPMLNFDIDKFSGVWYEVARAWYAPNITTKCHKEIYDVNKEMNEIFIEAEFQDKKTNRPIFSKGFAVYHEKNLGLWPYEFPAVYAKGHLIVLKTDYEDYAILYTCESVSAFKIELAWLVSRQRNNASIQQDKEVQEFIKEVGNNSYFVYVDQTDCNNN